MRTAFSNLFAYASNRVIRFSFVHAAASPAVPRVCSCQGGPHGPLRGRALGADAGRRTSSVVLPRKEDPARTFLPGFPPLAITPHPFRTSTPPPLGGLRPGVADDFGWCDGRCVQASGTYSLRRADPRLLATPASRRRGCSLRSELGPALWICPPRGWQPSVPPL